MWVRALARHLHCLCARLSADKLALLANDRGGSSCSWRSRLGSGEQLRMRVTAAAQPCAQRWRSLNQSKHGADQLLGRQVAHIEPHHLQVRQAHLAALRVSQLRADQLRGALGAKAMAKQEHRWYPLRVHHTRCCSS